jgi:hypothetical protein
MANEFKHKDPGSTLTQTEFIASDGTGHIFDSQAQGDILYATSTTELARLGKDANTTRALTNTGTNNNPAWAQIALATGVSGTLPVGNGGSGATSLTDGGVLLGSGTAAVTAMAVLADSEMIVGDGTTDPVAESGATLRTSIGVGTGDSPQLTGIELGHASDTTIVRSGSGAITVEGNQVYLAGGTDVALGDGGTGASLSDPGADRLMFWDDSASAVAFLTASTNLTISGTNITASGGISNVVEDTSPQLGGNLDMQARLLVGNGGSTGIAISADGEVNMAAQPCVLARNSSTDANVTGAATVATLDFDTEVLDAGSNFASDTFTAPVTGQYLASTQMEVRGITSAGTQGIFQMVASNRTFRMLNNPYAASISGQFSYMATAIIDMDADDTLTVTYQGSNESSNVQDIHGDSTPMTTYISIQLLA